MSLLLLMSLAVLPGVIISTNPGAKIRISQAGLNYGANVAVQILSESVNKLSIPDQKGSKNIAVGKVEYQVTNMKVTNFRQPSTSVTLNAGSGLTWSVSNAAISLHGDWHYKYRWGFVDIRDSGSFDGDVTGVSVSVSVVLGVDAAGRPTITSSGCNAHIQDIHISVHGGASWLYNLFIDDVVQPVRGDLERLICDSARKAIDNDASRELATLDIQVDIDNDWLLDYRLVQSPLFTTNYLEAGLKGEFYHKDDTTEAPFQADVLPNPGTASSMVTIWMSDYVLNTAGYVAYKHNILKYTLTKKDLPAADQGYLDTICHTTPICIGNFLPAVAKLFPNASIELDMLVTEAPKAVITPTNIQGTFVGTITYYARLTNGSLVYLFKTSVNMALSLTATLESMTFKGKISNFTQKIEVIDSAVGPISGQSLTAVFGMAAKKFIVPKLNKVGQKGFPIPMIKHVNFLNPNLSFDSHALCLTTDVQYLAK